MATSGSGSETSFVKTKRTKGFTALLTSAACEWFLIFLLLVDAVLSYLLTKFANYCQLQAPCLLCSRLDRVLGGENTEFYLYLLCSNHRSEISTFISCHIHGKVANGRNNKPYIPLPHAQRQSHSKHQNTELKLSCDPLCHVGYTELKFTSNTESDFPFSDDDGEASDDPIAQFTSASLPSDMNPAINWHQMNQSEESKINCVSETSLPSPPSKTLNGTHTFVGESPEKCNLSLYASPFFVLRT